MRFAVCCSDAKELRHVCSFIEEYAAGIHRNAVVEGFRSEESFWRAFEPGVFRGAVVGYGDVKGFLCARRLREEDSGCRVVLLDDTERYAIRGLRIHLSGFLLRPLEDERLRAVIGTLFGE